MQNNTLGEDVLLAIQAALETESPKFVPVIQGIFARHPSQLGNQHRGDSADDAYTIDLPPDVKAAILAALTRVDARDGYDSMFGGYQINMLISAWREIAP